MSELGDYRRLVEQPMIAKYEATIASLRVEIERLTKDLERTRHKRLEDHDVLVARGEAEPL